MPTLLPKEKGQVPPLIVKKFNESLSTGSCLNFMLLSEENWLTWLKCFANMVLCSFLLKAQLNEYHETTMASLQLQEKAEFVKLVSPTIKNVMLQILFHLIFPSMLMKVTTSKDHRALLSLGSPKSVVLLLLSLTACSRVFRVSHPNPSPLV